MLLELSGWVEPGQANEIKWEPQQNTYIAKQRTHYIGILTTGGPFYGFGFWPLFIYMQAEVVDNTKL